MKKRMVAIALAGALAGGIAIPVESAFGTSAQGCAQMIAVYNSLVDQYEATSDPFVKQGLLKGGLKLQRKILRRCF